MDAPAPGTFVDVDALLRLRHVAGDARRHRAHRTSALPGPVATRRRGRGTEIDEVRLWSHGDDVRHLDRNATARTGIPHVRTFRDEREQTTLLLADFRPSMLFGTRRAFRSVAAAEILALAGWRALAGGGRVALLAVKGGEPVFVRAASGERAMTGILRGLQRAHEAACAVQPDEPPLDTLLDMAARSLPRGGTVILASSLDTPGEGFDDAVRRALHRVDLRAALISDAFERTAPRGAYPYLTLDGVRGVHIVGGNRWQLQESFFAHHPRHPGMAARPYPESCDHSADDPGSAASPSAGMTMSNQFLTPSAHRADHLRRLGAQAVPFEAEQPPERQMIALERLFADG